MFPSQVDYQRERIFASFLVFSLILSCFPVWSFAQDNSNDVSGPPADVAAEKLNEIMKQTPADLADNKTEAEEKPAAKAELNILAVLLKGGYFMIPIGIMSVVVAVFGIERFIALRRNRIIPREMVTALGQLSERQGGLDPRLAYRLCQKYRCTASNVIRAVLLKVGRPHSEVEHAVSEISEREASLMYKNVRPINLAMAITPLMGLLGTVWGMIQAFFVTSQAVGGAKAQDLADGIYVALVTTLAGLAVAIIAAILAHYFEGKIQGLFRDIDDLVQTLLPQLERYEGKLRLTRSNLVDSADVAGEGKTQARPSETPQPATTSE